MAGCEDHKLLLMMRDLFASNDTLWQEKLTYMCSGGRNVSNGNSNVSLDWPTDGSDSQVDNYEFGRDVYAYLTPVIIVVGVIGNVTSLKIFTIKAMQAMSAGLYLAAISLSDLLVILTFVLLEWLAKGLQRLSGEGLNIIHIQGICQVFLLLSYTFRFTSVWLIVVFTVERYIAVDKPLHRRVICSRTLSKRFIASVFLVGFIISLYKPALSGVVRMYGVNFCARRAEHINVSFYLDAVYGFTITIVPLVIITVFNLLILKALLTKRDVRGSPGVKNIADSNTNTDSITNSKQHISVDYPKTRGTPQREKVTRETRLRLEFTIILLAVSTSFICLNIPFFVVWLQNFLLAAQQQSAKFVADQQDGSGVQTRSGLMLLTKTIFFFNYCVNFFLYALTGRQFRLHLKSLFNCSKRPSSNAPFQVTNAAESIHTDAYGTFKLKTTV